MAFFDFLKKKAQPVTCNLSHIHSIRVLGGGCRNCKLLLDAAQTACRRLDLGVEVEYITDMETIVGCGVMKTPALMVNDKIVSAGRVLTVAEVEKLLNASNRENES